MRLPMKALILVDIQNDFLPGGALAVPKGNDILPVVDVLLSLPFDLIVATKDWHPANHASFAENQGKNPGEKITCSAQSNKFYGPSTASKIPKAQSSPGLNTNKINKIIYKGTDKDIDSYSTFFDNGHNKSTGLEDYLRKHGVKDLYIAGLATEYCVKYSVIDALKLGFNVFVIVDACRGINLNPGDSTNALQEMQNKGAVLTTSTDLVKSEFRGGGIRTHDLFVPNEAR